MSRFGTRPSSRTARRESQRGSSLPVVLGVIMVLTMLVAVSLTIARDSTNDAARAGRNDVALQVADAGVNRYISRLVEDPRYWDHFVDQAEDPRVDVNGVVYPPGSPWVPGTPWTYAGPPVTTTEIQDARFGKATYSLRITPPPAGSDVVTVQSHGGVNRDGGLGETRTIQSQILPTSIADFQMISNKAITYGSAATTTGKVYSSEIVNHLGVAKAPVYGQSRVCSSSSGCSSSSYPSSVFQAGAYDSNSTPSFSDKFPTPIDFSQFTRAIVDIKDAAQAGGIYKANDPAVSAWLLQFMSNGTVKIYKARGTQVGNSLSGLGCPEVRSVPANGAMYFEQSVIVSDGNTFQDDCNTSGPRHSVVDGRVTVATPGNVYIGGNIAYETEGDDVLGLIATNDIIFTRYTPTNTSVRAATLAQYGLWRTWLSSPTSGHNQLVYTGSQTTNQGGYASQFANRDYNYDPVLRFLRPPFYPIIEGSWETRYWREVTDPA